MRAGFWEILLIVVLVLILFGHSKIPDLMKNLAQGINVFKKELKNDDEKKSEAAPVAKPAVKKAVAKKPAIKKKSLAKKPVVKKK
ncbi:MAG: twin-arginine translocase TatA/TatE family subunit [Alphaproteobacteria bacterium]|nr:twin-arginine translocase TatA/TatE family subunit [Alphaproteobacteria bacterium]